AVRDHRRHGVEDLGAEVLVAEYAERLLSLIQGGRDPVDATAVRRRELGKEDLSGAERVVVGLLGGEYLAIELDLELLVLIDHTAELLGLEDRHRRCDLDPLAALPRLDKDVLSVVLTLGRHVVPGALRQVPVAETEADLIAEDDILLALDHIAARVRHVAEDNRLAIAGWQVRRDAVVVGWRILEEDVAL